jgi:hypothetical protein
VQWQAFCDLSTLKAEIYDGQYYAVDDDGKGFIFDIPTQSLQPLDFVSIDLDATDTPLAFFFYGREKRLYLIRSDFVAGEYYPGYWTLDGSTDAMAWQWASKGFDVPDSGYSWAQVVGDTYPVTFELMDDGDTVQLTKTVSSKEPFRLPALRSRRWRVRLSGDEGQVRALKLATDASELR